MSAPPTLDQARATFRTVLADPAILTATHTQKDAVYANFAARLMVDMDILNMWAREMWIYTQIPVHQYGKVPPSSVMEPIFQQSSNPSPSIAPGNFPFLNRPSTSNNSLETINATFTGEVFPLDQWKAKFVPIINDPAVFDLTFMASAAKTEAKRIFMILAMQAAGFQPDEYERFNELIFSVYDKTVKGRQDTKYTPILIIQKTNAGVPKLKLSTTDGIFVPDEELNTRVPEGVPKVLLDYRLRTFQYRDFLPGQLNLPTEFYYKAVEALELVLEEDILLLEFLYRGADRDKSMSERDSAIQVARYLRDYFATFFMEAEPDILENMRKSTIINIVHGASKIYVERYIDEYLAYVNNDFVPRRIHNVANGLSDQYFLDDLWTVKRMMIFFRDREYSRYPDTPLADELEELVREIDTLRQQKFVSVKTIDVKTREGQMLQNVALRFAGIISMSHQFGRRCINTTDPSDPMIELATIPERLHFRFSTGVCWEITSLMDYLRRPDILGDNSSRGLKGYLTPYLWPNPRDLQRLSEHPLALTEMVNGEPFGRWLREQQTSRQFAKISDKTMQMMLNTVQLGVSRGPYFVEQVPKYITEQQLAFFRQFNFDIYDARRKMMRSQNKADRDLFNEIELAVATVMKSNALIDFLNYYDQLSNDEKQALESIMPNFRTSVTKACTAKKGKQADMCVFVFSRVLKDTYNVVARRKKIPEIKISLSED